VKNSTGVFAVIAADLGVRATAPIGATLQGTGVSAAAAGAGTGAGARLRWTHPAIATDHDSAGGAPPV